MSEQYGPPEPHVHEPDPAEGMSSGAYGTDPPYPAPGPATDPPHATPASATEPPYETPESPYATPTPTTESPYATPDPTTPPPYETTPADARGSAKARHAAPGPVIEPPHPLPGPATPPSRGAARVQARPAVPRWLSRLPYAFVLCGVGAGLAVVATNHFRRGSMLIAAAVFIGALARLVLPESQVGMLAVRRRWLDVFLMTTAAVGITLVAFVAKGTSG
jgi:Protein of unknown function (DUF3017)